MTEKINDQNILLSELWKKYKNTFKNEALNTILSNYYCYSEIDHSENKDILVFGINPSLRKEDIQEGKAEEPLSFSYSYVNSHKYFSSIKKMMGEYDDRINYLDLFCYRHTEQVKIKDFLKEENGIKFLVDHLIITQDLTEALKPKLIIVKNAGARVFFGREKKQNSRTNKWTKVWMGYEFEDIKGYEEKQAYGYVKRITGILDDPERVNQNIKTTNLEGTIVLFTTYEGYARAQPDSKVIKDLLYIYENEK